MSVTFCLILSSFLKVQAGVLSDNLRLSSSLEVSRRFKIEIIALQPGSWLVIVTVRHILQKKLVTCVCARILVDDSLHVRTWLPIINWQGLHLLPRRYKLLQQVAGLAQSAVALIIAALRQSKSLLHNSEVYSRLVL